MRTLCWGKLPKDYRFKSLLFLAFICRLFIQIFRGSTTPLLLFSRQVQTKGESAEVREGERGEKEKDKTRGDGRSK